MRLDPAGLAALQESLAAAGAPGLPTELGIDELALALASDEVRHAIDEAERRLREHGVVDDDGPVGPVVADLVALATSTHRIRVSLAGPGTQVLGHYWVGPELGGSVTRDGSHAVISLFDARDLGTDLVGLLPRPEADGGRRTHRVSLESLATIASLPVVSEAEGAVIAELMRVDAELASALHAWSERVRAVLHVTVVGPDAARLPAMLVWFLAGDGWWSARTSTEDSVRMVELEPRAADDLPSALGLLATQAWR
ncbi:hypothetical protein [Nocardioides sp.]|uniref:hypothetical protein n=1 Tax=Nocardioides sp. TaxID=35761 RepID=UPI00272484F6|nr:hypothetical protein [Nocardioides sp.]MDO9458478.1 hypothetical protein [Nocardioides sp.]